MARSFYYMAVSFLLVFLSSALMSVASSILNGPGRDVLIIFWQFPLAWVLLLPTFFVLSDFLPEFQFWKIPLAASLFFVVWALAFKGQPMSFFASLFIAVAVFPFLINWFVEPSLKIGSFNFKRETLFLVGGLTAFVLLRFLTSEFLAVLKLRIYESGQPLELTIFWVGALILGSYLGTGKPSDSRLVGLGFVSLIWISLFALFQGIVYREISPFDLSMFSVCVVFIYLVRNRANSHRNQAKPS